MKKILILLSVLIYQISFTQEILVKGNVIDNYELPFPGSQVINLRTNKKAITNFDGNYSIIAKLGDTLKFKAFEKVEDCYTIAKRMVYATNIDEVKLFSLNYLSHNSCKTESKKILAFVGKFKSIKLDDKLYNNEKDLNECSENPKHHGFGRYDIISEIYGDFGNETNTIKFEISESIYSRNSIFNNHAYAILIIEKYCSNHYRLLKHRTVYKNLNNQWVIQNPNLYSFTKEFDSLGLQPKNYNRKKGIIRVRKKDVEAIRDYFKPPFFIQKGNRFYPAKKYYAIDYFNWWKSSQKEWKYDN